jgi:predicted Zn-dependent peptidase
MAQAAGDVVEFFLDNGMQVVVITDDRAPAVTHMVWYRVGAADEPPGMGPAESLHFDNGRIRGMGR